MNSRPVIDLHQDLLAHVNNLTDFPSGKQTDFEMLKTANVKIVVATAFPLPPQDNYFDPSTNDLIEADFRAYVRHTQIDPAWSLVRSAQDVRRILSTAQAYGIIMHVEGLNVISEADWPRLQAWYELGWRSLGIVWNLTNPLGGGTQDAVTGLTSLGSKMLAWLEARSMIIDFAHMNQPTFWQALEVVKGPIYVSHGNACARCPSPRNYTDEQLRAIAERDGVVGIFFANTYVVGRERLGTVRDIADHIEHCFGVMGTDHVALGSDFGGIITGLVKGMEALDCLPNLWLELSRRGYSDEDLERLAWKNAARVLCSIL